METEYPLHLSAISIYKLDNIKKCHLSGAHNTKGLHSTFRLWCMHHCCLDPTTMQTRFNTSGSKRGHVDFMASAVIESLDRPLRIQKNAVLNIDIFLKCPLFTVESLIETMGTQKRCTQTV